ncbi:MAG TPA: hypothetical protein V6C97_00450 [Oculatellaceae cyanobacterium]
MRIKVVSANEKEKERSSISGHYVPQTYPDMRTVQLQVPHARDNTDTNANTCTNTHIHVGTHGSTYIHAHTHSESSTQGERRGRDAETERLRDRKTERKKESTHCAYTSMGHQNSSGCTGITHIHT